MFHKVLMSLMTTMFSPIASCVILLLSLLVFEVLKKQRKEHRRAPGPLALPIIGHLHLIGPMIHRSFHQLSCCYGPLFQIRIGSVPCFVASSPEVAKELLKTHGSNFISRKHSTSIKLITYDGSFAFGAYGPYWRFIKKLITQELLGTSIINRFRPFRAQQKRMFLKHLMNGVKIGDTINLSQELLTLSINLVSQMMLSMEYSGNEATALRTLVREVTQIFGEFNISDVIGFCRNFDLQGIKKRSVDIHKRYDAFLEKIITARELQRKGKKEQINYGISGDTDDFLDVLFDAMENDNCEVKLTRDHIKAVVLDFISAGSDTTAISIEWALAELINNPNVLNKAQQEIDKVVGPHRLVEESDCPNLPYIQAIVKESYRLHPPIPLITRRSVNDCKVYGYQIPSNALLIINIFTIGRNPKFWSRPLEFRPDRFLDPTEAAANAEVKGHHFDLLPFGTGRRGCPGMPLALEEVPTVLATMIQCFDFKVVGLDGETSNIVDMTERIGLTTPRAHDLKCILVPRIDPSKIFSDNYPQP